MNAENSDPPLKSTELRKLEMEYELATRGFAARAPKTYAALIVGFLIFIVTALVLAANGKQLFPGWPLVWIFGVFGAVVIIYYLFLYRTAFKLRAQIAREKKRLEIAARKSME